MTEEIKQEVQNDDLAENFAKLLRQEEVTSNLRKQLDDEKQQLAKDREEISKYKSAIDTLKKDPLAALNSVGITFKDLATSVASRYPISKPVQSSNESFNPLKNQIEELKKETEYLKKREQARVEQHLEELITQEIKSQEYDVLESLNLTTAVKQRVFANFKEGEDLNKIIKKECKDINKEIALAVKKVKGSKWVEKNWDEDEPTEGLTAKEEKEVKEIVKEVKRPAQSLSSKVESQFKDVRKNLSPDDKRARAIRFLETNPNAFGGE